MPVLTTASAISRISLSLTLQPNLFQLFQPMGGVAATAGVACACAAGGRAVAARARIRNERNAEITRQEPGAGVFWLTMIGPPPFGSADYKGLWSDLTRGVYIPRYSRGS